MSTETPWEIHAKQATSVIRMIRGMIGEMFGPIANIESEEATLLRGPEAKQHGEAILEALGRVGDHIAGTPAPRTHLVNPAGEGVQAHPEAEPQPEQHPLAEETTSTSAGAQTACLPGDPQAGKVHELQAHVDSSSVLPFVLSGEARLKAITSQAPSPHLMGIETAPKDGTWFIAYQNGEPFPCDWRTEEQDETPPREGWFDFFNRSFEDPTHWLPVWGATTESAAE